MFVMFMMVVIYTLPLGLACLTVYLMKKRRKRKHALNSEHVLGVVESAWKKEVPNGKNSTYTAYFARIKYFINGIEYIKEIKDCNSQWKERDKINVYALKDNPDDAMFESGEVWWLEALGAFLIPALVIV